ncbi:MAG: response regulator [Halobacteria archaeon]|nr:response regulator [Halobacteria archaeon]
MGTDGERGDKPTVLIVDDEEEIVDLYSVWLDSYDVRVAYTGTEALERIDEDVDLVVLDRLMPDISGDEILEEIRDNCLGTRVVVVTAVSPSIDVLNMEIDDYVVKPVERDELTESVENVLSLKEYDEATRKSYSLSEIKEALESSLSSTELYNSREYSRLQDELDRAREKADEVFETDTKAKGQKRPNTV